MRIPNATSGKLSVRVIAGSHVILMAFDVAPDALPGLRGFAIKRAIGGSGKRQTWLTGIKYFKDLVPDPVAGTNYSSRQHPLQTFLWSDYTAAPDTAYDMTVVALYGDIGALEERYAVPFSIRTEPECDAHHGIWFNRGAIASQALATQFKNTQVTPAMFNDVDADGQIRNAEVKWLSRGLVEACIGFINGAKAGEGLRVCAYEFTYQPVLQALRRALARGVDVRIIYHLTDQNTQAIGVAGLPQKKNGKTVLIERTRPPIPHNKFIVKLAGSKAVSVWTGSVNFTDTGFLGQTNVGHLVIDQATATTYRKYWDTLSSNPAHTEALANATTLTPNPPNVVGPDAIVPFYSPRIADNMLDWYGQRISDADTLALMTIPFNVAPTILKGLSKAGTAMRLVILEDPPAPEVTKAEIANRGRLAFSNGAILGKSFIKYKSSFGGAKVAPIPNTPIVKWFVDQEMVRPVNNGHVFFVHSKVLVIDPLSDDPLVCSGSANFSTGSLTTNDENMLLIRGNQRVADIYFTEFDRIFRHFFARDAINAFAKKGDKTNPLELDTSDGWIAKNTKPGSYKSNRRDLFFPPPGTVSRPWTKAAAADKDPFADEKDRAAAARKKRNDAAAARRSAAVKKKTTTTKKTAAKKKKTPKTKTPVKRAAKGSSVRKPAR